MNSNHHLPESTSGAACAAVVPLLPLVAQRLLEPEEAQAVRTHVAGCRSCQARLAAYDGLDHALRRHFEQIASSPIRVEELMRRVRYEEQSDHIEEQLDRLEAPHPAPPLRAPAAPMRPVRRSPRRVFSWVAAIAAVLVIALITTALFASHHSPGLAVKPRVTTTATPAQSAPSGVYFAMTSFPPNATSSEVYALKAQDGSLHWQASLPAGLNGSWPVLSNGILYFLTRDYQNNVSENNAVYAMSASDGHILWHTSLQTPAQLLQIVDGVIYTGTSASVIFAINASDGTVRWHTRLENGEADVRQISNGLIYASVEEGGPHTASGSLYALNAVDGSVRWHYQTHGSPANISIAGGQLDTVAIFSQDGSNESTVYLTPTFYALDASSGTLRWSYAGTLSKWVAMAAADAETVYLTTADKGSSTTTLLALNASDGSVRWQKTVMEQSPYISVMPDNIMYLSTNDGISALSLRDGSEIWHAALPGQFFVQKVINGTLYATSASTLLALDSSDGSVKWRYQAPFAAVYAGINNVLYGSSVDHPSVNAWHTTIFALDAGSAKLLWQYKTDSQTTVPVVG